MFTVVVVAAAIDDGVAAYYHWLGARCPRVLACFMFGLCCIGCVLAFCGFSCFNVVCV